MLDCKIKMSIYVIYLAAVNFSWHSNSFVVKHFLYFSPPLPLVAPPIWVDPFI